MTTGGEETEVGLVNTVEDLDVHTVAHILFLGRSSDGNDLSIKCVLITLVACKIRMHTLLVTTPSWHATADSTNQLQQRFSVWS